MCKKSGSAHDSQKIEGVRFECDDAADRLKKVEKRDSRGDSCALSLPVF